MLERLGLSFTLAFIAFVAASGVSHAQGMTDDQVRVAVGTLIVALVSMAVLYVFYRIKRALGGFNLPPPDEHEAGAHH
jgi:hypothetical protein